MDRRRFHRQQISLSALAHPAKGHSWLCEIRDFCQQGMLLAGAGTARAMGPSASALRRDDPLALHFSVASPTGQKHFRLQSKVARLLENGRGVGVVFEDGLPAPAFQALLEFVGGSMVATTAPALQEAASGGVTPGDAGTAPGAATLGDAELGIPLSLLHQGRLSDPAVAQVRQLIRGTVREALEGLGKQYVDRGSREFLASARDAGNNLVHQLYLDGLDLLERHGNAIVQNFVANALAQLEHVTPLEQVLEKRRRRETGGDREMSVVDSEQFEDWLALAELIARAEARFGDVLLELRARFGLMAPPWAHKDAIPVGPSIIVWAFADALKEAAMRRELRHDSYRYFERVLLGQLASFYDRLSTVLERSGLFPPASQLREALQRRPIVRPAPGPRSVPGPAAIIESDRPEQAWAPSAGAGYGQPGDPLVGPVPRGGSAYQAARRLWHLDRQHRAAPVGQEAPGAKPGRAGKSVAQLSRHELLEALSALQREVGDVPAPGARLKPQLLQLLADRYGEGARLESDELDNLDVMETLIDALESDRYLTEGARTWIRRLELTLNKLAAHDRAFLEREAEGSPHSAVVLLNQLARLGSGTDAREGVDRDIGRRVDELLGRVIREFDGNPDVIEAVVDELYPLVDKQERAYRTNLERTVRSSEGRQKLVRARRAVLEAMQPRLGGRDVPELALQLLNPGWRNLLVHTHLRRGTDSPEWQEQLDVFGQLLGQLDGSIAPGGAGYVDPDALLKRVVHGLNSISFDPSRRTPLIMALSAALVGDVTGEREPVKRIAVAVDGVAPVLGFEGLEQFPDRDDAARAPAGAPGTGEGLAAAIARVRRLEAGDWLATTDADGRPQILAVAFVGDDFESFVLVNRKGVKIRECALAEIATDLVEGRITLLDDFDLPLVERASQRMLESMHGRLAYQATHDELTTLLNRREFERLVAAAVQTARATGETHVLLYLDLDQFKIINNTSGHKAGDELLKRVAAQLTAAVANERVLVARLGGDEFGLLAEHCPPTSGRELARRLLNSIREAGFQWEGRAYNLSATIGLVIIDRDMVSVDFAMQYADEACYAAKDAGRNRIQEYQSADSVIRSRHGAMESVTHLDRALIEDRLILNCQRIEPVDPDSAREAHYEILLTMADESGRVMPPADFIAAAETYQRMAAIDRWVIARALRWMTENRGRLEQFGGFAINVSGHSMNDETFPDFVLQQFESTGAPTSKVCFEITETAAIANLENAREFMNRMKIIGCRFALDDFGSGLSSYSYLRNLPVDYVKIDGVFVKALAEDADDFAVVRSINEIGHYLGKQTIAECVESPAIMDRIRSIGVDFAQGFYVGKPVPLDDLFLRT